MESEEKMLRRYCGVLRLSPSETHPTATFNSSGVEATISKSAKFRFVGNEAFKVGDYCDGSTRRSSTKGSVVVFVHKPERDRCGSHHITTRLSSGGVAKYQRSLTT